MKDPDLYIKLRSNDTRFHYYEKEVIIMKKLFVAVMLIFSINTAQAVSYDEQKFLYLTMHSSILLTFCQYPYAGQDLVDVAKTLGARAGYSDQQLGQLHKKIMSEITYKLKSQGGLKLSDCDNAVNFHAYVMKTSLGARNKKRPFSSPRLTK